MNQDAAEPAATRSAARASATSSGKHGRDLDGSNPSAERAT